MKFRHQKVEIPSRVSYRPLIFGALFMIALAAVVWQIGAVFMRQDALVTMLQERNVLLHQRLEEACKFIYMSHDVATNDLTFLTKDYTQFGKKVKYYAYTSDIKDLNTAWTDARGMTTNCVYLTTPCPLHNCDQICPMYGYLPVRVMTKKRLSDIEHKCKPFSDGIVIFRFDDFDERWPK